MNFCDSNKLSIDTKLPMQILYIGIDPVVFNDIIINITDKDSKSITVECNSKYMIDILNTLTSVADKYDYTIIGSNTSSGDPAVKIRIKDSLLLDFNVGDIVISKAIYIGSILSKGNGKIFLVSDSVEQYENFIPPTSSRGKDNSNCYNCGSSGHYANMCPQPKLVECFYCGNIGHVVKDCTMKNNKEVAVRCYRCNEIGHYSENCPQRQVNNNTCFECGEYGHFARECTMSRRCYRCGKRGHFVKDCSFK